MHFFTFEHNMLLMAGACVLLLIFNVTRKARRRSAAFAAEAESFAGDLRISDDEYAAALTGEQPAFTYEGLYRPGEIRTVRRHQEVVQLPDLRPPHSIADTLERDSYITGRAVRIIRRAEEERTEWHWDELTGTWQPGLDMVRQLPWDDWLRQLLLDEKVAA